MKLLAKNRRGNGARHRGANGSGRTRLVDEDDSPSSAGNSSSPETDQTARLGEARLRGTDDIAADLAPLFKLLADETRLRILQLLLQQKEIHVRALCERLGQSQPAVSHHLGLLREAGLIDVRREGKHNFYHMLPAGFRRFLDMLFAGAAPDERRIRFEQYVLSYAPATVEG